MTTEVRKTIRDIAIIIIVGFLYYLFYRFTGLGIPCAFHKITGLPCPSCGISHMFIHLAALDFKSAFNDNQFLFFTWPLVAAEIIFIIFRLESGKDLPRANVAAIITFAVLLTVFGVMRILFSWY